MRALATGLLLAMALLFVVASLAAHRWPAAAWVRAFAEAGMVGACADWFAVTALFRRPFGLPIPHTGIIPRNKDRIGEALGAFLADNFLTEAVLDERLRRLELARWGGEWIERPGNAARLAARIAELAPEVLGALPPGALRALAGSLASTAANAAPASVLAGRLLSALWAGGRAQAVVDRVAEGLGGYLADNQALILEKVQGQSFKWLPGWIDKIIAKRITAGLIQLLTDVRDPAHPLRLQLDETVRDWAERLVSDPELRARGEALKAQLLADPRLTAGLDAAWAELERRLDADLREHGDALAGRIEQGLLGAVAWLREDEGVQALVNGWARGLARGVIAPRRHEIGRFVAAVVASWDATSVVEKLELQVGADLQYIRINGTIVGGLVGLLIHAVSRLAGLA